MKSYIELVKEIQDELKWEPDLFESRIKIDLNNGIVTLSGNVGSANEKNKAESVAKRMEGVKSVVNQLQVKSIKHENEEPLEVPSPNSGDSDNTLKISGA